MKIKEFKKTATYRSLLDKVLIWSHKSKLESGDEKIVVNLPSHTIEENRRKWNDYDWSKMGNEWTEDVSKFIGVEPTVWKNSLINEIMFKYISEDSNILEIGPGAGRWTEILLSRAKHLTVADISEKCLEICKDRFDSTKIDFRFITNFLDFMENDSVDFIWSYDVFVHINPIDIEKYLIDINRILKPNGYALIHHSGTFSNYIKSKAGWRAFMGKSQFESLVKKQGMKLIEQDEKFVHCPGDVISIFSKI